MCTLRPSIFYEEAGADVQICGGGRMLRGDQLATSLQVEYTAREECKIFETETFIAGISYGEEGQGNCMILDSSWEGDWEILDE